MDEKKSCLSDSVKEVDFYSRMPGIDYSGFTWLGLDRSSVPDRSVNTLVILDEVAPLTEEDYEKVKAYLKDKGCSLGSDMIRFSKKP